MNICAGSHALVVYFYTINCGQYNMVSYFYAHTHIKSLVFVLVFSGNGQTKKGLPWQHLSAAIQPKRSGERENKTPNELVWRTAETESPAELCRWTHSSIKHISVRFFGGKQFFMMWCSTFKHTALYSLFHWTDSTNKQSK